MKRKNLALRLAVSMIFSLTACGGFESPATDEIVYTTIYEY